MRLALLPGSRVLVDLRATGLLRAALHDPTLAAPLEPATVEAGEGAFTAPLDLRARVDAIEVPAEMSAGDQEKMRENLRGPEVLDAARFPAITLRARYTGTLEGGRVEGELLVRGAPRRFAVDVRVARDGAELRATGVWEGRLTDLGVRPFRALLGALRLDDWARLRVEARLGPAGA